MNIPKVGTRLIVFQGNGGQATVIDADKPNRASVGFEQTERLVAHDLKIDVPSHGLTVEDFPMWKREREAEGTVFDSVSTIF